MHTKVHTKGFTLVETLVAISILTISILGTFTAVQSGLQSSSFAKDQITAFYLVQETMEYLRNVRDENAICTLDGASGGVCTNDGWLTGISADGSDPCTFDTVCRIDSYADTVVSCGSTEWESCPVLNQHTTGVYSYTSGNGWTATRFKREVKIESITPDEEISIAVRISWTSGSFTKNFTVRQNLRNWQL